MFSEVFFIFLFKGESFERNQPVKEEKSKGFLLRFCQNVNQTPLPFSKADAKVEDFNIPTKYIFHFFLIFLKLFPNSLISKDVVEHKKSRKQAEERKGHIIIYAHVRAGT